MAATIIGVFGGGAVRENSADWRIAEECGRLLAEHNCIVLTGGLGGVMAAASKGAKEAGGTTVGIMPGEKRRGNPNRYIDIAIYTGVGEARNVINVKSCDAAIAIGGEYGTLSEIALALKIGCPLVLVNSWSFSRHPGAQQDWLDAKNAGEAVQKAITAAGRR